MVKKTTKIIPDKSLYGKLAKTGYTLTQALSELVDNAIDERLEEKLLDIQIKLQKDFLEVMDNARGMDEQTAVDSVVLGKSKKKNKLGEFGLGLKTASLSIGDKFIVYTSKAGLPKKYTLVFDREEWETRSDIDWENFPYDEKDKKVKNSHGTTVRIEKPKYNLYGRVTELRRTLAKRYAPFIKNGEVHITVNNKKCKPKDPELIPDSRTDFTLMTPLNCTLYGWYGLLKEGSMKGAYGFNTFRRGRLITTNDKIAIGEHPTLARIVGDINMNEVPVTHNKREWETESAEYKDVEEALKKVLKDIIAKSRSLAARKRIKKKAEQDRDSWLDKIAEAVRNPEIKHYFKPKTPDKLASNGNNEGNGEKKIVKIDVEKRNLGDSHGTVSPTETKARKPKITHEVERSITIGGKKFTFTHKYETLGEKANWKEYSITPEKVIDISTNIDFPAFSATTDQAYYAAYHIAETLAEVMVKDANEDSSNIGQLKESILRYASKLKTQISDKRSK